ncbi:hypothetical protein RFI_31979 [Reticulomyxa filosa]|uniref:Uncharacterized protein n=1 Tax=Reticulomyxa filosa TaxID=46433 RepID=X6LXI8_RETFI|nr:hypothetical protein RFI_31979 [Reticulomyxa filosa]|eukprot:ETO05415.1 hypothetical protein RFI_31979 [Reticulomyxa filosa]
MRRANMIYSCDVSWISPFKHEREILFSKSNFSQFCREEHKEFSAWNAKIESEDENTQMILLTWTIYDQFIRQTMSISFQGSMDQALKYLLIFEKWRNETKNKMKYEEKKKEFMERRCCNHHINLFCISVTEGKTSKYTPIELAIMATVRNGLPFVETNKEIYNFKR